jgi:hypothetical protein
MTTVRQLLDEKGGYIWSIGPDATVFDAVAKMAEKDIGSLVVIEGDEFVGIITERHYARNVVLKGKTSPATPVRDIMERHVVIARPEQSVDQCMIGPLPPAMRWYSSCSSSQGVRRFVEVAAEDVANAHHDVLLRLSTKVISHSWLGPTMRARQLRLLVVRQRSSAQQRVEQKETLGSLFRPAAPNTPRPIIRTGGLR